jgi:hypothetical protein
VTPATAAMGAMLPTCKLSAVGHIIHRHSCFCAVPSTPVSSLDFKRQRRYVSTPAGKHCALTWYNGADRLRCEGRPDCRRR